MLFSQIRPFARFSRILDIPRQSPFLPCLPCDHRLFFAESGEGHLTVDGRAVTVPEGGLFFIRSGVSYRLEDGAVRYLAVNFDQTDAHRALSAPIPPVNLQNADTFRPLEEETFSDLPALDRFALVPQCRHLAAPLREMVACTDRALPYDALTADALLTTVLAELARALTAPPAAGGFDTRRVLAFVRERAHLPLDNRTVAREFGFHPNYLSAEFKRHTGRPLHRYLLECRINRALTRMDAGESDLQRIAAEVGFNDYNYFSRYFKKLIGVSPRHYLQAAPITQITQKEDIP